MPHRAIISVIGPDQKGIVARFATFLAQRGINLEDTEQQVVHGRFIMDMLADLGDGHEQLEPLAQSLAELGRPLGMEVRVTAPARQKPRRIVVLVSRERHCLDRLIADQKTGRFRGRGEIVAVLSNHADMEPVAKAAALPFQHKSSTDKAAHMAWLGEALAARKPDLVVLARYMQVLSGDVVKTYHGRNINIHPTLLPHFAGAAPYQQAWETGTRISGCTAHYVVDTLDEGPIIHQETFHIDVGRDSAADVKLKGMALEARVLSEAIQMHLDQKLTIIEGKVIHRRGLGMLTEWAG